MSHTAGLHVTLNKTFLILLVTEPLSSSPYPDPIVTKLYRIHICIIDMIEMYLTNCYLDIKTSLDTKPILENSINLY